MLRQNHLEDIALLNHNTASKKAEIVELVCPVKELKKSLKLELLQKFLQKFSIDYKITQVRSQKLQGSKKYLKKLTYQFVK